MTDNMTLTDNVADARLKRARKLLSPQPQKPVSLKSALLSSIAFAAAALMLAAAIIMGPGWERAPSLVPNEASPINDNQVSANPKAMMVQAPPGGFELSASPLSIEGVNEAVPLSEEELVAGEDKK
ncbi:hypothetical protein OVA03_02635 [Asticcacaulis sp. SL142]|uniref:hypothetical protein n=1 Tax=Asticcacaulis sp. SL142 TaxID=2995155 RepID=UPI00226CDC14|nr:hypothetical protein [Asticcacaulis sp. SL142]WAC48841.1 hypothetical protein OVA03_02635 [Asticcacaulis sp. SL142]